MVWSGLGLKIQIWNGCGALTRALEWWEFEGLFLPVLPRPVKPQEA